MNEPIIICETEPRQSYNIKDCVWHTQYAVKELDQSERDEIAEEYSMREIYKYLNAFVALRRKITVISGKANYGEWELIDCAGSQIKAVAKCGDSVFYTAKSTNNIHTKVVEVSTKIQILKAELKDLEDQINRCRNTGKSKLQEEWLYKFETELKAKRLYSKYKSNNLDDYKFNEIYGPIAEGYKKELKRIENRISVLKKEISELEEIIY